MLNLKTDPYVNPIISVWFQQLLVDFNVGKNKSVLPPPNFK